MDQGTELAKIIGPLLVADDGSPGALTSQASLFHARDLTGGEVVLKRTTARSREQLDSAQNEVSLLRKIRHPNVVAYCGVWYKPLQPFGTEVNLLMELCPGGHLLDLQRRREQAGRPLTEQEIVRLFVQCCRGVECLHRFDPPVAHRDVKLENLLLGGEDGRTVKLCDFGSATTRRTLVTTKEDRARLEDEIQRLTTPSYRAPELVDLYSRKLISEQVDIWALGCVLYALAFGKHAFGEEGSALAILNGKFNLPCDPYYSQEFRLLFFWLFDADPNIRPRIGDVVDELDLLLGNKIKIPAVRRGSGCGDRSISKLAAMEASTNPRKSVIQPPPVSVRRSGPNPTTAPLPSPTSRGAAFVQAGPAKEPLASPPTLMAPPQSRAARSGAMESRRNQSNRNTPVPLLGTANGGGGGTGLGTQPSHLPQPSPRISNPQKPQSNNPFDELLPSINPTFYSTPGMRSTSVAGFPDEILQADIGTPFDSPAQNFVHAQSQMSFFSMVPSQSMHTLSNAASSANVNGSAMNLGLQNPSQAPIFFSDPPPQWRANTGL